MQVAQGFPSSNLTPNLCGGWTVIEQMRLDFPLAAKAEEWTAEDQAAIGEAVKAAIAAGDDEALAYWAGRIGDGAARWRAWCDRVRAIEAAIKAQRLAA
jgi:hypothetical protein